MAEIVSRDDLTITETVCETLSQVTLWPEQSHPDLPGTPGQIENGVARIGPTTWIVFGETGPSVSDSQGTSLDLGHSRKCFRISGARARDVMRRLAPLDFRDKAFPDRAIKATSAHHISVWIARDGEDWDVYVGYTFADGFRDLLAETAAQWESA